MDEKRILSKIDQLDLSLEELKSIEIRDFKEYKDSLMKKRACERLLQMCIEIVLDICNIFVSDLRLGLPSDEEDVFKKLSDSKIISKDIMKLLPGMKNFRNVLVHKYGEINDKKVFENIKKNLKDFEKFRKETLEFLRKRK